MRWRLMRRIGMGMGGCRKRTGMLGSMFGDNLLKYYYMSCGTQHKQTSCPECGSKMKRAA
jgi:ribosomal protein L37AE/L43A